MSRQPNSQEAAKADDRAARVAAAARPVAKSAYSGGFYEIQSIAKIPGGVEVYIRAWDSQNRPIGFKDGTVEIEKIRVFNPPALVPDPNGTDLTLRDYDDNGNVDYEQNFRLDPAEALKLVIQHTIQVKADKFIGRVVPGKVGRTTDVIFSSAGDGAVECTNGAVWATARSDVVGAGADYTGTGARLQTGKSAGGNFQIRRAFTPFDTSTIPDYAVITAATIDVWPTLIADSDNDGDDWVVVVGPTTRPNVAVVANSDIATTSSLNAPIEGSGRIDITTLATGAYYTWTLNANGIGWINKTGMSDFGWREGHDVIDSPYAAANGTTNSLRFSTSEVVGTVNDPKLSVTYTDSLYDLDSAAYTLGAQALNYDASYALDSAAYTLTAQAMNYDASFSLDNAAYTLTAQALNFDRSFDLASAAYLLGAQAMDFDLAAAGLSWPLESAAYVLSAEPMDFITSALVRATGLRMVMIEAVTRMVEVEAAPRMVMVEAEPRMVEVMAERIVWPVKDPDNIEIYGMNWNRKLQGDTIISADFAVDSGSVTLANESYTTQTTSVKIAAGDDGEVAEIRCRVNTANGQQFDCVAELLVQE